MEKEKEEVQRFMFRLTSNNSFCLERSENRRFLDKNRQYLDIFKTENIHILFLLILVKHYI